VVFLLCIVTACGQTNKVRYERNEEGVELSSNYEYGDELPCKPDTVSYPVRNSRLFEDILDVYIDNEKLSAKDDFIAVSSGCWTDSTYIVIMEHYKWNDSADSLIYLERGQASSY